MTAQPDSGAASILAVVLTCQKYIPMTEHMLARYETLWPDHPFVFRVPEGPESTRLLDRFGDRVQFVHTAEGEGRGRFRQTVFDLLSGIDDEAWILWSMDDYYPMSLDLRAHRTVANHLSSIDHADGISLCRIPFVDNQGRLDRGDRLHIGRYSFERRTTYHRIWVHQFLRAKVLRSLFTNFPDVMGSAKEMDHIKDGLALPSQHRLYVATTSRAVYGESSTRGRLTRNCAQSMAQHTRLPDHFSISPESRIQGRTRPDFLRIRRTLRALKAVYTRRLVTQPHRPTENPDRT